MKIEYWIILSIIIPIVFLASFFKKSNFNDFIKKISKSSRMNFKIYGELTKINEKSIKPYSDLLKDLLKNSTVVSKNVDIRFLKKTKALECEIKFLGGNNLNNSKTKKFTQAFNLFQKAVEKNGGDISITNQFSSEGKMISSALQFSLPS